MDIEAYRVPNAEKSFQTNEVCVDTCQSTNRTTNSIISATFAE